MKGSNPPPPKLAKPEPPPNPPQVFIPDWGKAERIQNVLQFTTVAASHPAAIAWIGKMVCELLAKGQSVYVKAIETRPDHSGGRTTVKREGDQWVFSSGRTRYGYTEKLGIEFDPEFGWQVSYGYDNDFWRQNEWNNDEENSINPENRLTPAELMELADHQIAKWQEFRKWLAAQEGV